MFIVVKPLGMCCGWGSSHSVALLSTARCAASLNVFFVLVRGASRRRWCGGFLSLGPRGGIRWRCGRRAVGGDRRGSDSGCMSGPYRGSPQLRYPLGEPSVRAGGPLRRCASAGA
ncbi:unnamed protein product [Pleuronectes platessa]|uniref:Uncharacterized protein n=1 Tax=Pleuronectes platessa TaxID=8262 RepID=A0A9N7USF8_PLEPL|nr:unnamed protein product [Pleuronectes platessa]